MNKLATKNELKNSQESLAKESNLGTLQKVKKTYI